MTVINPPVWMQAGTYNAEQDRIVTGLLIDRNTNVAGSLVGLEGGVVPPLTQLRVTESGDNNMITHVAGGLAVIPRPGLDPPGAYICYNQGSAEVPHQPASTNPRNDLIVARVKDLQSGDPVSAWELGVIMGAEASTPVDPATSGAVVPLARVRIIPSHQNGNANKIVAGQIFDLRQFISGPGGVHLTWGNPNPKHSPGRLVYDVPSNSLWVSDGRSWDPLYSFSEWNDYFTSYRPVQAYRSGEISSASEAWDGSVRDEDTNDTMSAGIITPNIATPSGLLKVTLQGYSRSSANGVSAHLSYVAKKTDGTTVGGDNAIGRGPSGYITSWTSGSMTSLLTVPVKTTVRLHVYMMKAGGDGRAYWMRIRLTAEPIL